MPSSLRYLLILFLGFALAIPFGHHAQRFWNSEVIASTESDSASDSFLSSSSSPQGLESNFGNGVNGMGMAMGNLGPSSEALIAASISALNPKAVALDTAAHQGAAPAGTLANANDAAPSLANAATSVEETPAIAPDSIAGISAHLNQTDPFIDDLTAEFEEHTDQGVALAQAIPVLETKADEDADAEPMDANAFEIMGTKIRSGTRKQLTWNATETFSGAAIPTAVLVVHGAEKGPVMCLTAGVHGDELNGIETVRRVVHKTKPEKLKGTLIGVPIVNLQGFQRQSRYLPDRRDLNRFFPGHPGGSSASRIAHAFFEQVIRRCDALVDLHTGSFHRTNLPQLRANLSDQSVVELSQSFGSTVVLHSEGGVGTLRRAAVEAGIPAVTLEAGEPLRLQEDEVSHSVKGIHTLLASRKMYRHRNVWGDSEAVYYTSQWVRADTGGILFSKVDLGKRIAKEELLGTVTDPISNEREEIRAPFSGRVLGMALNQFVMPGFATFHIGIEADDVDEASLDVDPTILSHDVAYEPDLNSVAAEPTEE